MRRALVRAVLPAVLILASSAAPAQATSATSVTFTGVVKTAIPLTLTTTTTEITFTTTTCLEVAANVGKPNKPVATAGPCSIKTTGSYIGNCLFGIGATAGTYTDSIGQTYSIFLGFLAVYPTWTPSANFLKGAQGGTGFGEGTWTPDLAQCATTGTTTVPVTAEFAYELN